MKNTLEKYVEFVQEQIQKYHRYSQLINYDAGEINPEAINTALAQYNDILLMLISEYNRLKADAHDVEVEYQIWWDDKFTSMRRQLNPPDIVASKWLSKSEIESETRAQYSKEYREWQDKLFQAQQKKAFLGQLLDSWKKMDSILITISTNLRAEMRSLSLDNRLMYKKEELASSSTPIRREKIIKK